MFYYRNTKMDEINSICPDILGTMKHLKNSNSGKLKKYLSFHKLFKYLERIKIRQEKEKVQSNGNLVVSLSSMGQFCNKKR